MGADSQHTFLPSSLLELVIVRRIADCCLVSLEFTLALHQGVQIETEAIKLMMLVDVFLFYSHSNHQLKTCRQGYIYYGN